MSFNVVQCPLTCHKIQVQSILTPLALAFVFYSHIYIILYIPYINRVPHSHDHQDTDNNAPWKHSDLEQCCRPCNSSSWRSHRSHDRVVTWSIPFLPKSKMSDSVWPWPLFPGCWLVINAVFWECLGARNMRSSWWRKLFSNLIHLGVIKETKWGIIGQILQRNNLT